MLVAPEWWTPREMRAEGQTDYVAFATSQKPCRDSISGAPETCLDESAFDAVEVIDGDLNCARGASSDADLRGALLRCWRRPSAGNS
jgi:hypothetical protein